MKSDFTHLEPLGFCGEFELLRGRRTRTGASVLLKRAREGANGALRREATLASSLPGGFTLLPRLVESPPPPFIVMEDPGGELLEQRLKDARPALGQTLAAGAHIARALAELHERGVVHNGVRPDTILIRNPDGQAWLIDFGEVGAASSSPAAPLSASCPPGRLAYVSPERTGRTDCGIDARSDLYALGVVLYEMLTGAPPFRSDDALEQIHAHIAGLVHPPSRIDPSIPETVSDLVMKLLAKTPDERYQSAPALVQDLEACVVQWSQRGRIEPFALAQADSGRHLTISSRLYGREREVHMLLEAFDTTCLGRSSGAMLLVEGYSGIGKTALIQQLYRPIVCRQGYFLSGKFDQVARGVPFGGLIQAFRSLVRQLLTENEAQLSAWRHKLQAALGINGGVLAAVIPELEFVLGEQPVPIELGSLEAQNRLERVFHNFVAAVAQPEHPLILFLDDLQWADGATLGLLAPLLTSAEIRGMMVIGAYRDNELDASPQLSRTLAALAAAGVALTRISLEPLQLGDLNLLVSDTLREDAAEAAPLARLIHQKTAGNPFFVIQFLKLLEREGHVRFDPQRARWSYRIEAVSQLPFTDNVVDLMTRRIERLPPKSQYALTLAACIGNRFDVRTLATVIEQSQAATVEDLQPAAVEGLIVRALPQGGADPATGAQGPDVFAFLHDRVQQSAYGLIPAERRQMVHLTVGRLLRSSATPQELGSALFDVVHHLNLGRSLVHDGAERRDLAALNLAGGRRAKSSAAHDTALQLFRAGVSLVDAADWENAYELCFELHWEAAESQYLCGQFESSLASLDELAGRARTVIDQARVARLRSVEYENMARYAEALASGRAGLALLGVSLPDAESDQQAALEQEMTQIGTLRAGRPIATLVDRPTMIDPQIRMVMVILTDVWSAAYILGDATLARLISATMVRLSLIHGNVEESAYGYVTHAITVGAVCADYLDAFEFGRLALAVNERFRDARRRAKICQQFHAHVNFWREPFAACLAYAREAYRSGLENGDFLYAAYGAGTEPWAAILATQDLHEFVREYSASVESIEKLKNKGFADSVRVILNWARALQGSTAGPLSLSDATLDEDAFVRAYRDNAFFSAIHAVLRLHLCVLLGTPEQALQATVRAAQLAPYLPGTVWPLMCDFWHGLALAANIENANAERRVEWIAQIQRMQGSYQRMAEHCPQNFLSQAKLLDAEIARVQGLDRDAIALYAEAIEFAAANALLPYQALAHELLGRFHLQREQRSLATMHLARARRCYARWGAHAKADAMASQYSGIESDGQVDAPAGTSATRPDAAPTGSEGADAADGLDLFSVLKATQAIAGELQLDELLATLLRISVQNAGAERGALILETGDGPLVYASAGPAAASEAFAAEAGIALEQSRSVPIGIVNYVRRTGQDVVLPRADADEEYGGDPYVVHRRPRSVACLPIRKQRRTSGVLYLEHCRVAAVFTPARLRTLHIFATQAAVSLESARLFDHLKREIAQRQQAQEQLGTALAQVEQLRDVLQEENTYLRRDLIANVSHDLRTPLASMRGYLELLSTRGQQLTPAQREEYLGVAVRQSERLASLVDELFQLAKLDFKGVQLQRDPFSAAELAADVLQKFQPAAADKQIELRLEAQPRAPLVQADLGLIERVLGNLVGNAIRHTPIGGVVTLRLQVEQDCLLVQVVDTGHGIAPGELPFVFDRFYRGAGARTGDTGGAELSLAIVKRILDLHGCAIEASSDGSSGTCFSFRLPLHRPGPAAAEL